MRALTGREIISCGCYTQPSSSTRTHLFVAARRSCHQSQLTKGCSPEPLHRRSRLRARHSLQAHPGSPMACTAGAAPQVVVTRERGKNGKLMKALQQRGITVLELPLVETAPGPDQERLPGELEGSSFDWVVLTSPEAARVFVDGWQLAGRPQMRLAVVGGGTAAALPDTDLLDVAFTPSKANAEHLAAELPMVGRGHVLYPASAKAGCALQAGLSARGFAVERLNTYNTVPVQSLPAAELATAKAAQVVAFASPSAVKAWLECAGSQAAVKMAIACIGSTSAQAAERLGLKRVYYSESPGLDGFVESIIEALDACTARSVPA